MNKVLKITKDNIYPLTYAFNMENFGPKDMEKTVNKPSQYFSKQLVPLRNKILNKFKDIEQKRSTRYTLNEWFVFANGFWNFSGTFKSLTDYQTLG